MRPRARIGSLILILALAGALTGCATLREMLAPPRQPSLLEQLEQLEQFQKKMHAVQALRPAPAPADPILADRLDQAIGRLRDDLQRILQKVHDELVKIGVELRQHDRGGLPK